MPAEAWFTLAVIVAMLAVLVFDLTTPAAAVMGAVVVLLLADVIDSDQALAGFANPAPITVAALFVLSRAVQQTGVLRPLTAALMDSPGSERRALSRLLLPTAGASAFLNNTPIVAVLTAEIGDWAGRNQRSPSRFLMPLSFSAILGGLVTVLGTSTNIFVSGLLREAGLEPIGVFEIGKLGLPIAVVGLAIVIATSSRLLVDRVPARRDLDSNVREFVVDMVVDRAGPVDGETVAGGGLRHLSGVFLVQLDRSGETLAPVRPDTRLQGDDILRFVGKADLVVDLHGIRGLRPAAGSAAGFDPTTSAFCEVVLGEASPLIGRSLRQTGFRSRYQAAVVAIHRAGRRVEGKLGDVRLRVGDTLLLLSDPGFAERWYDSADFLLVAPIGRRRAPVSPTRAFAVVGLTGAVVLAASLELLTLMEAALAAALLLVATRVLSPGEARRAIVLDVVVLIAAAFGVGNAVEESGLAGEIAGWLTTESFGVTGALAGLIVATILLTELVTNAAAAAVMVPIAISVAGTLGEDPRGFAIGIAVAASASFLTPIGYQTNTMVYGPGGYRFGDYFRLGAPLTAVVGILIVILVPVLW